MWVCFLCKGVLVVLVLTYGYYQWMQSVQPITEAGAHQAAMPFHGRVLLVIAHPDDECMFFGPVLSRLSQARVPVYVLCLSTGNADQLGFLREKELVESCRVLGVSSSHVECVEDPELQDGMKNSWPAATIARHIEAHVKKYRIETLVTFDSHGVSGHPNHCAVHQGAKHFHAHASVPVQLYTLHTISLLRKYIGLGDLLSVAVDQWWSPRTSSVLAVSSPAAYWTAHTAMRQHTTQLVWFRWLYVTFSRYMVINELTLVA
ncbi:N-acetylglucosaminylphosphatidylinositol deacetylase [Spinellus fusiger]|nr:N-acetylglucosaminylphosphatidylinositol deacetylase [Spinellus fusiger]